VTTAALSAPRRFIDTVRRFDDGLATPAEGTSRPDVDFGPVEAPSECAGQTRARRTTGSLFHHALARSPFTFKTIAQLADSPPSMHSGSRWPFRPSLPGQNARTSLTSPGDNSVLGARQDRFDDNLRLVAGICVPAHDGLRNDVGPHAHGVLASGTKRRVSADSAVLND
jgi:hypothetical protein